MDHIGVCSDDSFLSEDNVGKLAAWVVEPQEPFTAFSYTHSHPTWTVRDTGVPSSGGKEKKGQMEKSYEIQE